MDSPSAPKQDLTTAFSRFNCTTSCPLQGPKFLYLADFVSTATFLYRADSTLSLYLKLQRCPTKNTVSLPPSPDFLNPRIVAVILPAHCLIHNNYALLGKVAKPLAPLRVTLHSTVDPPVYLYTGPNHISCPSVPLPCELSIHQGRAVR